MIQSQRRYTKKFFTFFPLLRTQRVIFPLRFLRERRSLFLFLFLAVVMTLVPLHRGTTVSSLSKISLDVFAPVMKIFSDIPSHIGAGIDNIRTLWSLRDNYARIQDENIALRAQLNTYRHLNAQNRQLHRLLALKPPDHPTLITGKVIADAGNLFEHSLLIALGQRDGVASGQAVIDRRGFVGQTIGVSHASSRILLLRDFNSRVPVLMEQSLSNAILSGDGNPDPILKHSENRRPRVGEHVFTSGRGGRFPAGIAIGKVLPAQKNGEYRVRLFADPAQSDWVRILDYHRPSAPR